MHLQKRTKKTLGSLNLNNAKSFKDNGYLIIPKLLSGELLDFIGIHAYNKARIEETDQSILHEFIVIDTPSFYGDFVMENLSDFLLPKIESAVGMKLLPTYAFFRVYKPGDILKKHTDRPACEISISLCLRKKGKAWPLYINNTDIMLEEGDAVIYKGCEVEHWREPYTEGTKQAQIMLHYVDADGPYTEWKNDKDPDKYFAQDK
jgi:hypothetical protein